MNRVRWIVFAAAAAVACGTDGDESSAAGTSGPSDTTAENSSGSTGVDPSATDPSAEATSEGDSSTGPLGPIPAQGISVDWVEANQAIGVRIGEDGGGVGPEGRNASLLANRITLIRAFWEIESDWKPRDIEAHLTINFPDGTSDTKISSALVEGESFIGALSESFFWGLMAEESQPGITYHIELFETDPAFADPSITEPPRLPADGSEAFVGIEDSYQILKVVLIPFNYDDGGSCVTQPDTSEETMQLFEDYLYMMNPVDQVQMEIRDNIDWNQELAGFSELNAFMSEMRFEENALPETYYYGLVDVCAGGLGGAGGQAFGIPNDPTSPDAAYQRVSSGLSLDPEWSAETFVHEVGHSQGRRHVACNGEEGGPDPTYPIEGGDLGEWGFGVLDFSLRHPTVYKDYMTYCNPAWVSTWGWNKVFPIIRELSTWDENYPGNGAPRSENPYSGSLLVGVIEADGSEHWHTLPGGMQALEPTEQNTRIEFVAAGRTVRQPAVVSELPDGGGARMIVAQAPEGLHRADRITRLEGTRRFAIDPAAFKVRRRTQ